MLYPPTELQCSLSDMSNGKGQFITDSFHVFPQFTPPTSPQNQLLMDTVLFRNLRCSLTPPYRYRQCFHLFIHVLGPEQRKASFPEH